MTNQCSYCGESHATDYICDKMFTRHAIGVMASQPKAEPPELPKNLQAEPAYPIDGMVMLSMRDPEWTGHLKHAECEIEEPHKIDSCGLWKPKASPSLEDAAKAFLDSDEAWHLASTQPEDESFTAEVMVRFARQQRRDAVAEFVRRLMLCNLGRYRDVYVDAIEAVAREMESGE